LQHGLLELLVSVAGDVEHGLLELLVSVAGDVE
jgi:hypothetical protein